MKKIFRELKIGQNFKISPYEAWTSEKVSDTEAKVGICSRTYKLENISPETKIFLCV